MESAVLNKSALLTGKREQISARSITLQKGVMLVQAHFNEYAFTPHRHDDYVIGVTDHGEQKFRYRGFEQCAKLGHAFVIHPDELHDGRPGTEEGYSYRAIHLRPELVYEALGRRALPFIPEVVTTCPELRCVIEDVLSTSSNDCEGLESHDKLITLADHLARMSGQSKTSRDSLDFVTLNRIKEQLECDPTKRILIKDLEEDYGMSRFSITRQFRQYLGTTPHRFLVMRRLEYAKDKLFAGYSISDAAIDSGFSDQSHFNRHFRQAFGISPHHWLQISQLPQ